LSHPGPLSTIKLWIEGLNSNNTEQFKQSQQIEQPPLALTHWTQK
jgi:hypothetical protein